MSRWAAIAAILLAAGPAAAHVAPSEDTSNRYLNVTPMADRVRLAYTVLIGTAPGRVARHALDTNHDGMVQEEESQGWARQLGDEIRKGLVVTIDGQVVPVAWAETYVGMDEISVEGGAFSLDLIAWLCAPAAATRRTVEITDPFPLLPVGETEVRLSDEPGVKVEVARIGAQDMVGKVSRFQAVAAPLSDGMRLVYTVGPTAQAPADGKCPALAKAPKAAKVTRRWPLAVAVVALVAVGIAFAMRRRVLRS